MGNIKKIININLKKYFRRILDLIFGEIFFIFPHLFSLIMFHIFYWNKTLFLKGSDSSPGLSEQNMEFVYYGLVTVMFGLLIHSAHLIVYEKAVLKYKKQFLKKGFEIYIENEYKNNQVKFFSGIGYFVTISIAIIAIYMSIVSIQSSLDIANSSPGNIDLSITFEMFGSLGKGIAMTLFVFIYAFVMYKGNLWWKRRFIEDLYFEKFYKKKFNKKK